MALGNLTSIASVSRYSIFVARFVFLVFCAFSAKADVNVVQHHNHASRDGTYIDPAFTTNAVTGLSRDLGFDGSIVGNVYAQPLYIDGGPGGQDLLIVATESDNVYALDSNDGSIVWQRNVGVPVPLSAQPCGNIDPLGITGTPVADLPSRSLFFDAVTTPDLGTTTKHLVYSLNVDTGETNIGWPVDVGSTAAFGGALFQPDTQNERGALAVLFHTVYVPYGGHWGDCGIYHGWVVGIPVDGPTNVTAWATPTNGGGAWAVGGIANDGNSVFICTGNTFGATAWSGGEAIIRLQSGPVFSGMTADYWAPTNWPALDTGDIDLGGSGPLLVDVPGATPSQLIVALGKDGNAYLLDRTNLGGVSAPLSQANVSSNEIIQAAATYQTLQGTYVVFENGAQLTAFRITPTSPPTIANAWSVSQNGSGSPFVTSTDGTNNVIVWGIGCEGDQRLHGFDGDTGTAVYLGGGANEEMAGTRHMNTAIAAKGRIYVAADNQVYAFAMPPAIITQPADQIGMAGDNANFQLIASGAAPLSYQWSMNGTNLPGATNTVLSLTNLQSNQAGSYSALVSNVAGSVTSAVAQLTVLVPPFFTLQPSNQTGLLGSDEQFQVTAGGSSPLGYGWTFEGNAIPGATNNVLLLANLQPDQAGSYAAILTNPAGSITSLVATLSIVLPPSQIFFSGTTISLSVNGVRGLKYLLEYKDTLDAPAWVPLPPVFPGNGDVLNLFDNNATGASRFYRIRSY